MMQLTDIKEIPKIIKEVGYKAISLYNQKDEVIVPYNSVRIPIEERLEQIKRALASRARKDGIYIIRCRHSANSTSKPDEYYIQKGNNHSITDSQMNTILIEKGMSETIDYAEAIRLTRESAEYKAQNEFLQHQNEMLQKKIDDLESIIEEYEKEDLSESSENPANWINSLSEIIGTAVNVFDRHFELKERQLDMMEKGAKNQRSDNDNIEKRVDNPAIIERYAQMTDEERERLMSELEEQERDSTEFVEFMKAFTQCSTYNPEIYRDIYERLVNHDIIQSHEK